MFPTSYLTRTTHTISSSDLNCPQCGSTELRRSHHHKWFDRFYSPLHRQPLRCRKCRLRFYGPEVSAAVDAASKRSHKRENKRGKRRLRHWMVEATIFTVLLLLFFMFLKYLTREPPASPEGSSLIHTNYAQPWT